MVEGTVRDLTSDSLWLASGTDDVAVATSGIERAWIRRGTAEGALLGGLAGLGAGVIVGSIVSSGGGSVGLGVTAVPDSGLCATGSSLVYHPGAVAAWEEAGHTIPDCAK